MESVLASDYSVEVTRKFTPDYINYISELYAAKSTTLKEKGENYTEEKIRVCFKSGRFTHGFYNVKCKDKLIWTFGVDDYCGWGVVSRMLRHNSSFTLLPVMGGVALPFVLKYLKEHIVGLCATQNVGKRDLFGGSLARNLRLASRMEEDSNNIFTLASRVEHTKLDYDVFYRNTRQQVYVINTKKIPPFERYLD